MELHVFSLTHRYDIVVFRHQSRLMGFESTQPSNMLHTDPALEPFCILLAKWSMDWLVYYHTMKLFITMTSQWARRWPIIRNFDVIFLVSINNLSTKSPSGNSMTLLWHHRHVRIHAVSELDNHVNCKCTITCPYLATRVRFTNID